MTRDPHANLHLGLSAEAMVLIDPQLEPRARLSADQAFMPATDWNHASVDKHSMLVTKLHSSETRNGMAAAISSEAPRRTNDHLLVCLGRIAFVP